MERKHMGYSDDDLDGTDDSLPSDIPVWNSGSIYFDDEVVEYQGKYYMALRKTSTDIPGRCKAGIWKALHAVDDVSLYTQDDLYEDDLYEDDIVETPAEIKTDTLEEKKPEKIEKSNPNTPVKSTTQKTADASEQISPSQKVNVKPVNKPITKKKTLKEQQEEQKLRKAVSNPVKHATVEEKKSAMADINSIAKPVPRKMTIAPSDQSLVNDILKEIDFNTIKGLNADENNITSDLLLPQDIVSLQEETVSWESSHPDIISSEGKVHCPNDGSDVAVNLSVTVSKNKTSATRFFTLWVKAQEKVYSDEECVLMVLEALNFDQIKGKNSRVSEITQDLELLTEGLYDTEIFWASKDRSLIDETGKCYQGNLSKNTRVRLYAIITKGNEERLKHFDLTLKTEDF
jgi:hypothetical protein